MGLADETRGLAGFNPAGYPGWRHYAEYLQWRENGIVTRWPDRPLVTLVIALLRLALPIWTGHYPTLTIDTIREPVLMLPFITKRNNDQPMQIDLGDVSIQLSKDGIFTPCLYTALLISQANCTINRATNTPAVSPYELTQRVPSYFFGCVSVLNEFAKKTYAPATEESRLAGAGAGLNDND